MGTTIRREPVTTSIPAAPDYKFLNITNFGGLQKSSNPFVVSSNTASDCLNVYVDEDNALSTRPRLQYQTSFLKDIIAKFPALGLTGAFDIIGVYDLHEGYLVHGVEGFNYYMFKYINKNNITKIDGDIPSGKCNVFEQDETIYVLDGTKYRNIVKTNISETIGYIPTTRVGKNKRIVESTTNGNEVIRYDTEGSAFESMNLLTDKYKETYFWDGFSEFETTSDVINIEDNYYKVNYEILGLDIVKFYSDNTFLFKKQIGKQIRLFYGILHDDLKNYDQIDMGVNVTPVVIDNTTYNISIAVCSSLDNKAFAVVTPKNNNSSTINQNGSLTIRTFNKYTGAIETTLTYSSLNDADVYVVPEGVEINMSENGIYTWINASGYFTKNSQGQLKHTPVTASTGTVPFKLNISDVSKIAYFFEESTTEDDIRIYINKDIADGEFIDTMINYNNQKIYLQNVKFLPQGKGFCFKEYDTFQLVYYDENEQYFFKYKKLSFSTKRVEKFYLDPSLEFACLVDEDGVVYIANDYLKPEKNHKTLIHVGGEIDDIKLGEIVISQSGPWYVQHYIKSNEPLVTVTRILNNESQSWSEWSKHSSLFKKSKLFSRFDNNTWFAANNYTFHTLYNDPTYIPLSSYNNLGEDFEPITGLSIVNDNILAAYKRNRIYIITPITVGNELTYSYTETKNIVGNDVIDAPILTILTEMPVIVSYDGIYALNQLENVQSSDRVTTLISEDINPNWLKESSDDIDKCLTMNRLYWTYFILPHKKVPNAIVKDKNYTKIYLLDNRTQSWFYWELPIYVISAMVKNNKTHFMDENGELYTLEITDLINKFNPDTTEYYDNLTKPTLIKWHWTSQILSLNTINYSKRLIDTTFVLTDTDDSDEYALNYRFKAFRKNKNAETTELTVTNDIEYVESITKRTMIPRFNFIQFTLSNTEDDQQLNNNKFRLVGLGLKYVLLGGMY